MHSWIPVCIKDQKIYKQALNENYSTVAGEFEFPWSTFFIEFSFYKSTNFQICGPSEIGAVFV